MLSVGNLGKGQENYYGNLAAEDYHLNGGEPAGVWLPTVGGRTLGLAGKVSRHDLHALFSGCGTDGTPLVQNADNPHRRPGYDLTFSAPKTVSVLWATAPSGIRQSIQQCQLGAVTHAIQYIEQEAAFSRRGKAGCRTESASVACAAFEHGTSRAADPQLHTHCLVPNIAVRADGSTGSLESKPLYIHKMVAGAIYRAELANLLQERLGVKIAREGTSFEIAGVPKSLCDHFSKRRQEIEKRLAEKGLNTAAAAAVATLETRQSKKRVPPRAELLKQWQDTAVQFGFTPDKVSSLFHRVQPRNDLQQATTTVDQTINAILERSTSFDRKTLLRQTLYAAVEKGFDVNTVSKAVDQRLRHSACVLTVNHSESNPRYTTSLALSRQKQIAQSVQKLLSPAFRPLSRRAVDAAIGHHSKPRDPTLEELKYHIGQLVRAASGGKRTYRIDRDCIARRAQRTVNDTHIAAVKDITRSRARIATLAETSPDNRYLVLTCCREAWQRAGYNVIGVSLSNAGVKRLYQETGIEAMSLKRLELMMHPTAKFQIRYHLRQLWRAAREKPTFALESLKITKDTVLVVDGAERLSFQQMADLTRDVAKQGGRLVLAGDKPRGPHESALTPFAGICAEVARSQTPPPSPTATTLTPQSHSTQNPHSSQSISRSM